MSLLRANRKKQNLRAYLLLIIMIFVIAGCAEDDQAPFDDPSIPENNSWNIYSVHSMKKEDMLSVSSIPPRITYTHSDDRLYMAFYDDALPEERGDNENSPYLYRIRYKSFPLNHAPYIVIPKDMDPDDPENPDNPDHGPEYYDLLDPDIDIETVTLLKEEGMSIGPMSLALNGTTPMLAYSRSKGSVTLEGADMGNQGDVLIGVRDGDNTWRKEIGAFGYNEPERNAVFTDALAMHDLSLKSDGNGNALLCFMFFFEGVDSFNFDYPDLRFISQPVNGFINNAVEDVAELEETIEGSIFDYPSGIQKRAGDACEMVINADGNPVVFYYYNDVVTGPDGSYGLRVARRIDGQWQQHEWVHEQVNIIEINARVKSDGLLALTYTIQDAQDFQYDNAPEQPPIPFAIRYAEEVDVVVGVDEESGEDIIERRWRHEEVDYVSICGRYSSMDLDSDDNPVVAYFDEMNFTENRFFSRIKISRRISQDVWSSETIIPEYVGLTIKTSPFDIDPGQHDAYYIGKYNYLWVDQNDRVNICSYSSISHKVYLFQER